MIYCHECGSEVAETDAFCPYCGITLQQPEPAAETPQSAESTDDDQEFDSTIVMSPAELEAQKAALSEHQADEEPPISTPSPVEESIADDDIDEVDSIPTPGVITDLEKSLHGDSSTKESYEFTQEIEPGEIDILPESIISDLEEVEVEETEIKENVVEESEVKEIEPERVEIETQSAQIEDIPEELDEIPEDIPVGGVIVEHEFSLPEPRIEANELQKEIDTEPETEIAEPIQEESLQTAEEPAESLDSEEHKATASVAEPEPEPEPETVIGSTNSIEFPEENNTAVEAAESLDEQDIDWNETEAVSEISMPADELEASDPYLRASQFDSVRIVDQEGFPPPADERNRSIDPISHSEPEASESMDATSGKTDTAGKRSPKLTPLTEGTVLLNRYEIVRKIGGGGMGAVYLASDNNLGGVVRAVKEMVQAHIEEAQQAKAVEDFKRESMILSSLDHVSIPTIFDYFYEENEGRFYLVMKYISGGDLAARLRAAPEGKIDELTVTEWALQIIDVLDYLHSQPSTIVYRDLKPSNIMIDGNSGRIMLIDFGIARSINQKEEKGVTAVGTMGYAPPELFSGKVEPRSDIYSLGSTMFHLLTGADPQSNPLLIFDFQKNPRPRQINPQLSDQIETILMRSVEYNADARFTSAAEMRSVLEEHLSNIKSGRVTYGVSEAPASVSLANQSVFCGFCGQNIVATDLFCAFCGAKQPIAQHGVHSEIYSVDSHPAKLVIQASADLQGSNYTLIKSENLIGRRDPMSNIFPEIDLSKYDPQTKISRRHAKVWNDGAKYFVEDLGSSNGTVIAAKTGELLRLIPHRPHPIADGETIRVGDTILYFVLG